MAHVLNQTILVEGSQKADIHFYFESDGVQGEWNNYLLFDPVTFAVPFTQQPDPNYQGQSNIGGRLVTPTMTILGLWSATAWWDYTISYENGGGLPIPMIVYSRDTKFEMDFTEFGGIKCDGVANPDLTGRLLITTNNFAPLGSAGFLVLKVRKN